MSSIFARNQKTTSEEMADGSLTDLPICKPDKLSYGITDENSLSSSCKNNFIKDVEIGGVEPPSMAYRACKANLLSPHQTHYTKIIFKTQRIKLSPRGRILFRN